MSKGRYDWKECERCREPRRVRVTTGHDGKERWPWRCQACKYEASVSNHEYWATKNRITAARLRAKQRAATATRLAKK